MSRLRADEVLNKAATGPFLATEGINVPTGKNITYNDLSETTVLDGTSLVTTDITTTTLTVDQVDLGVDEKLRLGATQELEIYQSSTASNIKSDLLVLRAKQGSEDPYITCTQGGSVELRYSGTPRFETTSDGVSISGDITSTYLSTSSSGLTSTYLNTTSTGAAVTGSTSSTDGWAGTTSSANVLGGLSMPFSCGLNGRVALPGTNATMIFGGSEYTGGGDNTEGATMPHDGTVVAATLHAEQAVGNLNLHLIVNGTQDSNYELAFTSPTISNPSVVQTFYSTPKSFSAGDRINFAVNSTTLTQMQVLTVTFFVKFD
tara:strand:+ start:1140 stop:2093 length:954 start_codon:yes stop_codon:yes gene_type:complete